MGKANCELEQRVEGGCRLSSPVSAEDDLVELALQYVLRAVVLDGLQAESHWLALVIHLDGAGDGQLAFVAAAARHGVLLGAERDRRLCLDDAREHDALGVHHRPAGLVQEQPGGLVDAKTELGLGLLGGDAVRVAGQQVDGLKPHAETAASSGTSPCPP